MDRSKINVCIQSWTGDEEMDCLLSFFYVRAALLLFGYKSSLSLSLSHSQGREDDMSHLSGRTEPNFRHLDTFMTVSLLIKKTKTKK